MLDWLKYRLELLSVWRARKRIEKKWKQERRLSEKGGKGFDEESLVNYRRLDLQANEDERAALETRRLLLHAFRYGIPVPQGDGVWDTTMMSNRPMLAAEVRATMRATIHKEQNERWQFWELRLKVIGILLTAATGAMGTLIGLIAIWKK